MRLVSVENRIPTELRCHPRITPARVHTRCSAFRDTDIAISPCYEFEVSISTTITGSGPLVSLPCRLQIQPVCLHLRQDTPVSVLPPYTSQTYAFQKSFTDSFSSEIVHLSSSPYEVSLRVEQTVPGPRRRSESDPEEDDSDLDSLEAVQLIPLESLGSSSTILVSKNDS